MGEGEGARRLYTNRGLLGDCCHFNGLDLVCKSSHPVTAVPLLPPQRFCSYLAFTPAMLGVVALGSMVRGMGLLNLCARVRAYSWATPRRVVNRRNVWPCQPTSEIAPPSQTHHHPGPPCFPRLLSCSRILFIPYFSRRLSAVAVSVQVSPLYAMIISNDNDKCLQPGCGELSVGYVPWVSYGVTLLAPWTSVVGVGHYLSVAAVAAVTIITFAALTVPDLATTERSVAVVFSTIVSGILAIVRRVWLCCLCVLVHCVRAVHV